MKNYDNMIQEVIRTINWNRIKYCHQVFDIKWEFEAKDEKGNSRIFERYPTVSELKEELRTLLKFAIEKDIKTLDYSNWLIFWTNEENAGKEGYSSARLEAIFTLEDTFVVDNSSKEEDTVSVLEAKLEEALKKERYEEAARLRDRILEKKNR